MCERKNSGRKNTQFLVQHMFFEQILQTMQNFHMEFLPTDLGGKKSTWNSYQLTSGVKNPHRILTN